MIHEQAPWQFEGPLEFDLDLDCDHPSKGQKQQLFDDRLSLEQLEIVLDNGRRLKAICSVKHQQKKKKKTKKKKKN
jgi:hypothetical protein